LFGQAVPARHIVLRTTACAVRNAAISSRNGCCQGDYAEALIRLGPRGNPGLLQPVAGAKGGRVGLPLGLCPSSPADCNRFKCLDNGSAAAQVTAGGWDWGKRGRFKDFPPAQAAGPVVQKPCGSRQRTGTARSVEVWVHCILDRLLEYLVRIGHGHGSMQ
jgi:hypothetical protein